MKDTRVVFDGADFIVFNFTFSVKLNSVCTEEVNERVTCGNVRDSSRLRRIGDAGETGPTFFNLAHPSVYFCYFLISLFPKGGGLYPDFPV
jgi:hypothetical protein